ncbi:sensor domain-containing diguanylate cyclase [Planctobacterium marinum]|uniref:GGDEF domain-containing protein n=1 Tax=Planctobacterium marinum TaxID=1631968 RepID=A0AA48KSW6_9ALTE|nr:hypothetical protein MACH26_03110 [Planctobacterium marinum]
MLNEEALSQAIPQSKMLKIIEVQTEISKIGMDLGMVMAIATDRAMKLLEAHGAVIELAEGDDMVYRAASGLMEPCLGLRLSRHSSLSGLCVEKSEILYSADTLEDDRVDKAACIRVGIGSMIVVPLKYEDNCVGVLKVASKNKEAFGESETCMLSLMSDMLAAIVFHAIRFSTDELYRRATEDPLTGLGNRAKFYDVLRQQLTISARKNLKTAVVMLDMDGLKSTNDTYGHKAGDAIIQAFAERLTNSARSIDTIARLGGDEFAIILPEVRSVQDVQCVIERLQSNLQTPLNWDDVSLPLKTSIGFAMYPTDSDQINNLVEIADQRMYQDKRAKKAQ